MKHLPSLFLSVVVATAITGCASAPSHFYTLNSTAKGNGAPQATYAVLVGPVFIPASVDRPQVAVTTAPNRVEFEEFNRWAAPLAENIARVVTTDLGTLLGTPRAATAPMPDFGPAYHVTIRVEQFETVRGDGKQNGEAVLDALWAVRGPTGQKVDSGHTIARETAQGGSFDALAAAHSRALATVSSDIANAIRSAQQP